MDKARSPSIVVIFGITGDLAQRKLVPALYHLFEFGLLDTTSVIMGITRQNISTEEMVGRIEQSIRAAEGECDAATLQKLQASLVMRTMSQTDPAEYRQLKQQLDEIESAKGECMDRLFYLSVPPQSFHPIVQHLGEQGLSGSCVHGNAHSRLLVEKPFGYDLASAEKLIAETDAQFSEEQIFRIDHYVAKDAVQDIITFRREYADIESLWNSKHISKVEITVTEKLDIEGRASFYDSVGALRDFIQSHLLQILSLVAMDLPQEASSQAIHAARLEALQSISPIRSDSIGSRALRGQYEGYRQEVNNPESHTETFARLNLPLENDRWRGTEFVLQTGKAMAEKQAYVRVTMRSDVSGEEHITFHIQPDETIEVTGSSIMARQLTEEIKTFNASHRSAADNPLGYERVFIDAIRGDHTVFTTSQEIIAAWKVVNDVVTAWSENSEGLVSYAKGSASIFS